MKQIRRKKFERMLKYMDKQETYDGFRALKKDMMMQSFDDFSIAFNQNVPVGYGYYSGNQIDIGVNGLYQWRIGLSGIGTFASDKDITSVLFCMYHEFRHAQQEGCCLDPDDPVGLEVQIYDIARTYNQNWYELHYHENLAELDAEFYASHKTFHALSEYFPDLDAEKLVVEHVNDRFLNGGHYMPLCYCTECRSLDDIDDAFQKGFDDLEAKVRGISNYWEGTSDLVAGMDLSRGNRSAWWSYYYGHVISSETGTEYNRHLAAFAFYVHPEMKGQYPDVAADTGFQSFRREMGKYYPETAAEVRERLAGVEGSSIWREQQKKPSGKQARRAQGHSVASADMMEQKSDAVSKLLLEDLKIQQKIKEKDDGCCERLPF